MDIREDIGASFFNDEEVESIENYISALRKKLWREGKILIEGYTYSEWKERVK